MQVPFTVFLEVNEKLIYAYVTVFFGKSILQRKMISWWEKIAKSGVKLRNLLDASVK